ncbi:MAG: HAD family phosphatase [Bacteroidota bacterium]
MIKNIIFDFGDVFINLDKEIVFREALKYGSLDRITTEVQRINQAYEVGQISSEVFIAHMKTVFPEINEAQIRAIWNGMLLDFPRYRLEFIEALALKKTHRLFLLSNTNAMHIDQVQEIMGRPDYNRFKGCFEQFYLSHEIGMRKPDAEIFQFVLSQNHLEPQETLFIDDTQENTQAAKQLGIRIWNLQVGQEDVIHLNDRLPHV